VRLFAAIDLSAETRHAMAAEQQRISAALRSPDASLKLKWIRPENAHLTLVFLGHVDDARVPALIAAIGRDVDAPPFEIAFGGIGVFPPRGAPRVLWTGITAGLDGIVALQRELAARVAAHGIVLEPRPFHPHLTLARWTASRPSDRARALNIPPPGTIARQRVASATLYESQLSPAGAAYTALVRANLART
jgi:2'-5' RNA ligase